jgi:hypothetical protein
MGDKMKFLAQSFVDYIKGNRKLWQAWWLIWILPQAVIYLLLAFLFQGTEKTFITIDIILLFLLLGLSWFFYVLGAVSSWQCSNNCKNRIWSSIARALIIIGPLWQIARLIGEDPNTTINLPLTLSLFGILPMLAVWLFSNPNRPTFFNKKYLMPIVILVVYSMLFIGTIVVQYDALTSVAMKTEFTAMNKKLPLLLDTETEFTKIYLNNHIINYQYRLINIDAENFNNKSTFVNKMRKQLVHDACENKNTSETLNHGFDLSYNYMDKNNMPIVNILVKQTDCIEP